MRVRPNKFYIPLESYREGERVSPMKHECRRGHVYATNAKNSHVRISLKLARLLENYLDHTDNLVFMTATKVCPQLEVSNSGIYRKLPGIS